MKLDTDIRGMSHAARGRELMRLRSLIRTHRNRKDNARCWHADVELYDRTLPEGARSAGQMTLPKEVLLGNCNRYIDRQQCAYHGCTKKRKETSTRRSRRKGKS